MLGWEFTQLYLLQPNSNQPIEGSTYLYLYMVEICAYMLTTKKMCISAYGSVWPHLAILATFYHVLACPATFSHVLPHLPCSAAFCCVLLHSAVFCRVLMCSVVSATLSCIQPRLAAKSASLGLIRTRSALFGLFGLV